MERRLTGKGLYDTHKPPKPLTPKKPKVRRVKVILASKYGKVSGEK